MVEREPQVRGGLRLPSNTGISEEETRAAAIKWDTQGQVEENLKKSGFSQPVKPSSPRPSVTAEQLTTVINKDYTVLYAQHLAWFNYTGPILARVRARLLQVRNEMRDIEVRIRRELRKKNRDLPRDERFNEKDIEDETWTDPRYKALVNEEQQFEQTKLQLEAYLRETEETLKVISRQVEIRKIELEGARSETSMPGRGRFPNLRTP